MTSERNIINQQAEMTESEAIQTAIIQVAIKAAIAAVMTLKEAHTGLILGISTGNMGEVHRPRHYRPTLR